MRMKLFVSLFVLTATLTGSGYAFAQNNVDQRIDRMERDIQTLSRAVYKGDLSVQPAANNASNADQRLEQNYSISIENRLSTIERQIQQLTGQIEELNFRLNKMQSAGTYGQPQIGHTGLSPQQVPPGLSYNAQPNTAASSSPLTISSEPLAAQQNPQTHVNTPVQSTTLPSAAPAQQQAAANPQAAYSEQPNTNSNFTFGANDAQDYDRAFAALKDGNYPSAQDGFKAFLETHKESRLVPNALYWLGETYYVQKQYGEAARIFAQGYQNHPSSNKKHDNLLKLGLSLSGMGKKEDACIALMQLVKDSGKKTPVLSRAQQEAKKLGCDA